MNIDISLIPSTVLRSCADGKLLANRYNGSSCAGCGRLLPVGEYITYFHTAERGQKAWHPACATVDPGTLKVLRTVAKAEKTSAQTATREDRRAAVVEAYRAVCDWLSRPGMEKLRDLLIAEIGRPTAEPTSRRPELRVIIGGGGR